MAFEVGGGTGGQNRRHGQSAFATWHNDGRILLRPSVLVCFCGNALTERHDQRRGFSDSRAYKNTTLDNAPTMKYDNDLRERAGNDRFR